MTEPSITIAIMLDFYDLFPSEREGIIVYLVKLVDCVLEYHPEVNFEVWCLKRNLEKCRKLFAFYEKSFPDRIHIYTEKEETVIACEGLREEFRKQSKSDVAYVVFPTLKAAIDIDVPVVVQVHDMFTFQFEKLFSYETDGDVSKHNNRVIESLIQYVKKDAFFFCSSEYTKNEQLMKFLPGVKKNQIKVVPYLTLTPSFSKQTEYTREEFLNKFDLPERFMSFPSQIRSNKNIIVLLKALKRLKEENIELTLVTTGKMSDIRSTREWCETNSGFVKEIGKLDETDLYYLYKYSTMIVCPNIIEGALISGQALEGLAIGGVPIIHGRSYGIDEALARVGLTEETAPLQWFDLNDDKELSERIKEVLSNSNKIVSEQQFIAEAFGKRTRKDFSNDYVERIESIISRERKND